jgi:polyhydroxybutyrate depolymerase
MKKLRAIFLFGTAVLPALAACAPITAAPSPGLSERKVTAEGRERSYYLYVPKSFDARKSVPVVLLFHGYGGDGIAQVAASGFNAIAEANGFLAAYPNGSDPGGELTWNGGECCGYAHEHGVDDTAFVREILSDIGKWASIDPARIFAAGFSNGGILSYRLACDMSATFAAVASVAGTFLYEACAPSQPVSVIHIHGDSDDLVPFRGGTTAGIDWPPAENGIAAWAQFDGCTGGPQREEIGTATRIFYDSCRNGTAAELYVLKDIGHSWPAEGAWPTSQTIWDFFAAHPKPEKQP